MTTKWLRREFARECPVHKAIYDAVTIDLIMNGSFEKEEVLKRTKLGAMEDSIRWDYIVDFLKEDLDTELVPLAPNYFKRHARDEEKINPGKFLASGHGKKTAGYGAVVPENDHLVIKRVEQRDKLAAGHKAGADHFKEAVEKQRQRKGLPLLSPVDEEPLAFPPQLERKTT